MARHDDDGPRPSSARSVARHGARAVAALTFLAATQVSQPGRGADADLLGVWHFDEAAGPYALDATGQENDARVAGAKRVRGVFGGALRFDGRDDHVSADGLGPLPEGTAEAWVNIAKPCPGQAGPVVFSKPFGEENDHAILGFCGSVPGGEPGRWLFGVYGSNDRWNGAVSSTNAALGEWVHLVGTWSADGLKLFVNGELAGEDTVWRGGVPAHDTILIGAGSWGDVLDGAVDEVRIYRRALTQAEARRHFEDRAYVSTPAQPEARTLRRRIRRTVSVADIDPAASFTAGIQEAIDRLSRRGGEVVIPAGTYLVRRTIHLPSNVTVRGVGAATVLTRPPGVSSPLVRTTGPGGREVEVEDGTGFEGGSGVSVYDRTMAGWYGTDAEIAAVRGNVLVLSRDLEKEYDTQRQAAAVTYYPILCATSARNVTIRDLCIDGRRAESPHPRSDFVYAAIHLVNCSNSRLEGCTVREYVSDGIGVQGGNGNVVTRCVSEHNHGHGFHPGTSLADAVFDGNIGRRNDWDGLYFCANVRRIVVSDSVFAGNGWNGIGGLGGGGDKYNVVSGNTCSDNGRAGIAAMDGTDNSVLGNVCVNNSTSTPGRWAGIWLRSVTNSIVSANRCLDDREKPTQRTGIVETGDSDHNVFSSNNCRGCADKGIATVGTNSVRSGNIE